jgi:hypothetical protein
VCLAGKKERKLEAKTEDSFTFISAKRLVEEQRQEMGKWFLYYRISKRERLMSLVTRRDPMKAFLYQGPSGEGRERMPTRLSQVYGQ